MLTFFSAIPQPVYRVGHARNPWSLPDWKYGPFDGRWDDPAGDLSRSLTSRFERSGAFASSGSCVTGCRPRSSRVSTRRQRPVPVQALTRRLV